MTSLFVVPAAIIAIGLGLFFGLRDIIQEEPYDPLKVVAERGGPSSYSGMSICPADREKAGRSYDLSEVLDTGWFGSYGKNMDKACGPELHTHTCPSNREGAGYTYVYKMYHNWGHDTGRKESLNCGRTWEQIEQGFWAAPLCERPWEREVDPLCAGDINSFGKPIRTPTPTATPAPAPVATPVPTAVPTLVVTPVPTAVPTLVVTLVPTSAPTPVATPVPISSSSLVSCPDDSFRPGLEYDFVSEEVARDEAEEHFCWWFEGYEDRCPSHGGDCWAPYSYYSDYCFPEHDTEYGCRVGNWRVSKFEILHTGSIFVHLVNFASKHNYFNYIEEPPRLLLQCNEEELNIYLGIVSVPPETWTEPKPPYRGNRVRYRFDDESVLEDTWGPVAYRYQTVLTDDFDSFDYFLNKLHDSDTLVMSVWDLDGIEIGTLQFDLYGLEEVWQYMDC